MCQMVSVCSARERHIPGLTGQTHRFCACVELRHRLGHLRLKGCLDALLWMKKKVR